MAAKHFSRSKPGCRCTQQAWLSLKGHVHGGASTPPAPGASSASTLPSHGQLPSGGALCWSTQPIVLVNRSTPKISLCRAEHAE